ncbi:Protein of unknown function DUF1628 [Methanocorpusculum labreanum Z]|uniref:Archaeal Type IV pilin N-terminal domain-containing protein n=1 Tax=Methanocorpusculum labreanum (strain ATCC 43576 / DSM 4855 / Z) TaxID=410358 RepID=A2STP7_METLZ|nr:type IV pilin N-terminal domain-containing protein [Methanocorpusculum labreanum]ABN07703.1 Protein of unknown function DUF1628 [Methanocorpusculum labreanum Z]
MELTEKDEGITSVAGEMLILALILILVSLFAVSAFNLLPGERETVVDVSMNTSADTLYFWHKGGDWVEGKDLTAVLTPTNGGEKIVLEKISLTDCFGNESSVFDLGGCYAVDLSTVPSESYSLRLTTAENVIYAKDGLVIS